MRLPSFISNAFSDAFDMDVMRSTLNGSIINKENSTPILVMNAKQNEPMKESKKFSKVWKTIPIDVLNNILFHLTSDHQNALLASIIHRTGRQLLIRFAYDNPHVKPSRADELIRYLSQHQLGIPRSPLQPDIPHLCTLNLDCTKEGDRSAKSFNLNVIVDTLVALNLLPSRLHHYKLSNIFTSNLKHFILIEKLSLLRSQHWLPASGPQHQYVNNCYPNVTTAWMQTSSQNTFPQGNKVKRFRFPVLQSLYLVYVWPSRPRSMEAKLLQEFISFIHYIIGMIFISPHTKIAVVIRFRIQLSPFEITGIFQELNYYLTYDLHLFWTSRMVLIGITEEDSKVFDNQSFGDVHNRIVEYREAINERASPLWDAANFE